MKGNWSRKHETPSAMERAGGSPLRARMRVVPTSDLVIWIDNSLSKIGKLVSDSQRAGVDEVLLRQAEAEASALVQALRELAGRSNAA